MATKKRRVKRRKVSKHYRNLPISGLAKAKELRIKGYKKSKSGKWIAPGTGKKFSSMNAAYNWYSSL
jgi:hypothetical protein